MKNKKLIDFEVIQKLTSIDKKSLIERTLKLSEEVGEVSQAVLSSTKACGCEYKNKSEEDIVEECVDVIIVASSIICQTYGDSLNIDQIKGVYKEKLGKWKGKCINNQQNLDK